MLIGEYLEAGVAIQKTFPTTYLPTLPRYMYVSIIYIIKIKN